MTQATTGVAVIGGGIAGLALALSLHKNGITCRIYESRSHPQNVGGALMLMPNGLKVLNALGLGPILSESGFSFDLVRLQDAGTGNVIEILRYGGQEHYGVRTMRIYRHALIKALLEAVQAQGIPIFFNHKFSHIIQEDSCHVEFAFDNGTTSTAALLVGADGIHSNVRTYLAPDAKALFTGIGAVFAAVSTAKLDLPADDLRDLTSRHNKNPLPAAFISSDFGAFVVAPQTKDGDQCLVMNTKHLKKHATPAELRELSEDKNNLAEMLREGSNHYPPIVQNAMKHFDMDSLMVWPFHEMPFIQQWNSEQGRVIIIGDAAHALPPSAGQGANLALEDVYMLALVLAKLGSPGPDGKAAGHNHKDAIQKWQSFRQTRVNHVLELNKQMNLRRLPEATGVETEVHDERGQPVDFDTLFKINMETEVKRFF